VVKNCAYCGKEFETDASYKKYCGNNHKKMANGGYVYDKATGKGHRPGLGLLTASPSKPIMKESHSVTTPQLDALGSFMVKTVERERDKIEEELKKLQTKYETLKDQKSTLEKQLDEATRALTEKPTGLSGIVQSNPDFANNALNAAIPLLNGLGEKLVQWITSSGPKQLTGGPGAEQSTQGNANPIWQWLIAQPKEVQENFVMLLEKLDATGKAKDYLESWNRQLMRVIPKTHAR